MGVGSIITGTKVSDRVAEIRLSICNRCTTFYNTKTNSCGSLGIGGTVIYFGRQVKLCGCYLPQKTKYKEEHCPIGKW